MLKIFCLSFLPRENNKRGKAEVEDQISNKANIPEPRTVVFI